MARKFGAAATSASGKTILCIDDQVDFLEAISSLLTRHGHRVLTASEGHQGLALLRSEPIDLLLLDFFMPGMTAEDVLLQVWDPTLQVILLTGYASEKPPREMLERLNIQGYCDKSRGPEELLLWVDVGLRSSATVKSLDASRVALRQILSSSTRSTERNPLEEVLSGLLGQASALLGLRRACIASVERNAAFVPPSSFEESEVPAPGFEALRICASLGAPDAVGSRLDQCLPEEAIEILRSGDFMNEEDVDHGALLSLRSEGDLVGLMWLEPAPLPGTENHELMTFLVAQAASIIRRHTQATLDLVTGLQSRGFWRQAAWRDLRSALRFQHPISLATIGLIRKDEISHHGWDPVLESIGRLVRLSIRGTDLAMRENDQQITVLLPHTDSAGAKRFAQLLTSRIAELEFSLPDGPVAVEAFAGTATLDANSASTAAGRLPSPPGYFERVETELRLKASQCLAAAALANGDDEPPNVEFSWPDS